MPATRLDALREALDAVGASALIQTRVDPMLLEYVRRYAPFLRVIPYEPWDSDSYNFNRRTRLAGGGPVRDGGARAVAFSTYERDSFKMKHYQNVGAVTGYAQAVTRDLVGDLKAREFEGAIRNHSWDIETAVVWGNSAATAAGPYPQFDGLDVLVSDFSGSEQNAIDLAGADFALGALDNLIELIEGNLAAPVWEEGYMFAMSSKANSRVAQLLTNQQRFVAPGLLGSVEVASGLIVPTYRNIPILKSSFLSARAQQMGAITTSTSTTGGTLAAATYFYRVTAVLERFGEITASTEVSQATTGSTSTVTLSFTPPSGPEGANPLHYKVYRSTTTGQETLLGYVDAVSLDGSGNAVLITDIVDDGTRLETATPNGPYAGWPTTYVGTNAGAKPRDADHETIHLVPRDRDLMLRPCVREMQTLTLYPTTAAPDELPYAIQTDCTLAVRAPKYMARADRTKVVLAS